MIWGGRKNRKWIYFFPQNAFWELFFPEEGLLRLIFSWRRPFDIFFQGGLLISDSLLKFIFSWGWLRSFFSLYEPIKRWPFFFSHDNFSGFIFSWGRPLFFLEDGFQDFFFSISSGPPPNGRPLRPPKRVGQGMGALLISSTRNAFVLAYNVLWISNFVDYWLIGSRGHVHWFSLSRYYWNDNRSS